MKVCDAHPDRRAVECLVSENDGTRLDMCEECKDAVLSLMCRPPPELGESPLAPPAGEVPEKAPKRGLSFFGIRK